MALLKFFVLLLFAMTGFPASPAKEGEMPLSLQSPEKVQVTDGHSDEYPGQGREERDPTASVDNELTHSIVDFKGNHIETWKCLERILFEDVEPVPPFPSDEQHVESQPLLSVVTSESDVVARANEETEYIESIRASNQQMLATAKDKFKQSENSDAERRSLYRVLAFANLVGYQNAAVILTRFSTHSDYALSKCITQRYLASSLLSEDLQTAETITRERIHFTDLEIRKIMGNSFQNSRVRIAQLLDQPHFVYRICREILHVEDGDPRVNVSSEIVEAVRQIHIARAMVLIDETKSSAKEKSRNRRIDLFVSMAGKHLVANILADSLCYSHADALKALNESFFKSGIFRQKYEENRPEVEHFSYEQIKEIMELSTKAAGKAYKCLGESSEHDIRSCLITLIILKSKN